MSAILAFAAVGAAHAQPGFQQIELHEPAKQPALSPTGARVVQFLDRLSSDTLQARRTARQALLAMGPAILPQLQWALDNEQQQMLLPYLRTIRPDYASAELTTLIDRMDDQVRRSPTSIVSLHYTNAPLTVILRDFASQLDAESRLSSFPKLEFDGFEAAPATIDLHRVDYWDALRAIQQRLGISPECVSGLFFYRQNPLPSREFMTEDGHVLIPPLTVRNAVVTGPLLIAPTPVERWQPAGTTVTLEGVAEPKVHGPDDLGFDDDHAVVQVDEYRDDHGQSLLPAGAPPTFASVSRYEPCQYMTWTVPLGLPRPAAGRHIGLLRGQFGVAVGPRKMELIVADLTRPGVQSFDWDDILLTLSPVQSAGDRYVVKGELSAPEGSPIGRAMEELDTANSPRSIDRARILLPLRLVDAYRRTVWSEPEWGGVRRESGRMVLRWTLTTDDPAPKPSPCSSTLESCNERRAPAALVWSTPEATHWLMVPFELHHIAGRPVPAWIK